MNADKLTRPSVLLVVFSLMMNSNWNEQNRIDANKLRPHQLDQCTSILLQVSSVCTLYCITHAFQRMERFFRLILPISLTPDCDFIPTSTVASVTNILNFHVTRGRFYFQSSGKVIYLRYSAAEWTHRDELTIRNICCQMIFLQFSIYAAFDSFWKRFTFFVCCWSRVASIHSTRWSMNYCFSC